MREPADEKRLRWRATSPGAQALSELGHVDTLEDSKEIKNTSKATGAVNVKEVEFRKTVEH